MLQLASDVVDVCAQGFLADPDFHPHLIFGASSLVNKNGMWHIQMPRANCVEY